VWRLLVVAVLIAGSVLTSMARASIPSDVLLQKLQPQGSVSDFAGILKSAERTAIEGRATELRRKTGAQLAVVILKSLEGGQVQDFANKLFAKWGVGEKRKNNGILLLVAIEDRKFWMEVGYGLEPILPDALAGRVLDENLVPAFKQQRYGDGLARAVNRTAEIIERGEPAPPEARKRANPPGGVEAFTVLFLSLFVAVGALAAGAGVRVRACFFVLWGLFFGAIPAGIVWAQTVAAGSSLWIPWTVTGLGLAMVIVGACIPWRCPSGRGRGGRSSGWGGWSIWDGGCSSGSGGPWGGGFGGGGFDSGGGFGGFGGGSSGGGGAGGSW